VGALLAGALADLFGMKWAIAGVALLTFGSGIAVLWRMPETIRHVSTSADYQARTQDQL
jgi:MFS family permease